MNFGFKYFEEWDRDMCVIHEELSFFSFSGLKLTSKMKYLCVVWYGSEGWNSRIFECDWERSGGSCGKARE